LEAAAVNAALIPLFLAATAQDTTLSELIRRLGEDSVAARDQAEEELIRRGGPAESRVREALDRSVDEEVRARLERVSRIFRWQSVLGEDAGRAFGMAWGRKKVEALAAHRQRVAELSEGQIKELARAITREWRPTDGETIEAALDAACVDCRLACFMIAELLKDEKPQIRSAALEALAGLQAKECAREIAPLIRDPDADVRVAAASTLLVLGGREELILLLKSPEDAVRRNAAHALGSLRDRSCAGDLAPLLKDPDAGVRWSAVAALAELEAKEHAREIVLLLKDPVSEVRGIAAYALGHLQAGEYADRITPLLESPDPGLRWIAAGAIAELKATGHASAMIPILRNPDAGIRGGAADLLVRLQAADHAEEIIPLLQDPDAGVRWTAADTMARLSAPNHAEKIMSLLQDPDRKVRLRAIEALGQSRSAEHAERLVDCWLSGPQAADPEMRWTAAIALRRMNASGDALKRVLCHPEESIRRCAEWVRGNFSPKHAAELGSLALPEGTPIRGQAIWALGETRDARAKEELLKIIRSGVDGLIREAHDALKRWELAEQGRRR
jgi:HEAT repeat protein